MFTAPAIKDIPKKPADRRAWVIYLLKTRGISLRDLAVREGVSHQALSLAFTCSSSHLQTVLAHAIGLSPQDLFPEFYDDRGNRIGRTRQKQRSTARGSGNVQTEKVA